MNVHEYTIFISMCHVTHDLNSWIFMLRVTCTHELMNIYVTRDVCSWICHTWGVLMNIHVTNDVYSWIFMLPVTWLMNIHVTRNVSWIFILPVTCTYEYSNYAVEKWIFKLPVTYSYCEYSLNYRRAFWILILPVHVHTEYDFQVKSTYCFDNRRLISA